MVYFFCGVVLVLKHVLENKGLVYFLGRAVEELFFGIVLVFKHMLENEGFVLETKALLFFLWGFRV